jgi:hypothetical protein
MISLSNRGYPMLKTFADQGPAYAMSIDYAQHYDQRPFRSMLVRGWIAYKPGRGFMLTKDGRRAWEQFLSTDIGRKNWDAPLTAYFDPNAYGLGDKKGKARRARAVKQVAPAQARPTVSFQSTVREMREAGVL